MSVFEKRFQESDPDDPIFNQVFIFWRERNPSGKNASQESHPMQQPSEPKEINEDQATLQLEKFLKDAQKLKVPVNVLGQKDYERWLNGPEDSIWCTKRTGICSHAAMTLNGIEDWQMTPLQQQFWLKSTERLMKEYPTEWLLENKTLLQEQLMMLFQQI